MSFVIAALDAENTFTDWLEPTEQAIRGVNSSGFLDLVASGTWVGTLTLQKRIVRGTTIAGPYDVATFATNNTNLIEDHSLQVEYRVGFKTGGYTSGTANVRLDQ